MPDITTPLKKSNHKFDGKELEVTVLRERPLFELISIDKFHTARHTRAETVGRISIGIASLKYRIFETRVYESWESILRTGGLCSGTSREDHENLSLVFKFVLQRDGLHIAPWDAREIIKELRGGEATDNLIASQ